MANKTPIILDTATLQLAELPSGDNLDLTGSAISSVTDITLTGQINGPSTLIIDPAVVGNDTGTVEIKGNLTVQGTTTTINSTTVDLDHLSLGDNEIANFGTGNDLQIYHDASNSVINNTTGDLYITDSGGNIYIQAKNGEQSIVAFADGAVDLYHNNTKRLETTSTGVNVLGSLTVSTVTNLKQVTETVVNNFNTSLAPSTGTLTIDTSTGTVVLGDLNASVTTWAFTNVPTDNSKAITVTAIIDGDTAQTYGDACSVNGSAVSGGIKWSGGSAPTATNNFDVITFIIVRDGAGTVNVFGSSTTNFS